MPLTTVAETPGVGRSVGRAVSARTGAAPCVGVDPMVIEVWDPPRRCEVRHEGRIVRGRGVFSVDPLADGRSRFCWEEQLPDRSWYGVASRVSAPVNRAVFAVALRRFKRWVEEGAA